MWTASAAKVLVEAMIFSASVQILSDTGTKLILWLRSSRRSSSIISFVLRSFLRALATSKRLHLDEVPYHLGFLSRILTSRIIWSLPVSALKSLRSEEHTSE